tara:strand:- start:185 stop:517 length:333 start_codon:yes stop_codon:yes gene_type:complete
MNSAIGKHKTTVTSQDGIIKIKYHYTDVVTIDNNTSKITLDHGGWRTLTTKTRMNQTSNEYGLGFRVYQKDFNWFVERINGDVIAWEDDAGKTCNHITFLNLARLANRSV